MFAVIKTGGKQYRVAAEDVITIEKLDAEPGQSVTFDQVLMLGNDIGAPFVEGASVTGQVVKQTRGDKVIAFVKRRRKSWKRKKGHRQDLTVVKITGIAGAAAAAAEAVQAPKAVVAEDA